MQMFTLITFTLLLSSDCCDVLVYLLMGNSGIQNHQCWAYFMSLKYYLWCFLLTWHHWPKSQLCLETKTQRKNIFVQVSCGPDLGSTALHVINKRPQTPRRANIKKVSESLPGFASLACGPALCVTKEARFHSSPARYFICLTGRKAEMSERRDRPISLRDLTNAVRHRFISLLPLNGF